MGAHGRLRSSVGKDPVCLLIRIEIGGPFIGPGSARQILGQRLVRIEHLGIFHERKGLYASRRVTVADHLHHRDGESGQVGQRTLGGSQAIDLLIGMVGKDVASPQ